MEILNSMLGQLGIDRSFFVMLGLFAVVFAFFSLLVLNKLVDTVVERSKRTDGRESLAQKAKEELEGIQTQVRVAIQEVRAKAHADFLATRAAALEEQRNIINTARNKATEQIQGARSSLQGLMGEEVQKLEKDIPSISVAIADKLLGASENKNYLASSSPIKAE